MKFINSIFSFILGIIVFALLSIISQMKDMKYYENFVYKGFQDYSAELLGNDFCIRPFTPKSIDCLKPMVSKTRTAATIAISILESKYGKTFVQNQQPFEVVLVNNKVWRVRGQRGTVVYIQKKDAKILSLKKK